MRKKKVKIRNNLARELWTPKYKLRVVQRKDKKIYRKRKHKNSHE